VSEVLVDAGWLCVPFAADDEPADCWQRAMQGQRAAMQRG
jgi:hypothetical protein